MDHYEDAEAPGKTPPRLEAGAGYYVWQYTNPLGIVIPFGVFDSPPPAGAAWAGITYRQVGHSRSTWFLNETTRQATKWITWMSRVP